MIIPVLLDEINLFGMDLVDKKCFNVISHR